MDEKENNRCQKVEKIEESKSMVSMPSSQDESLQGQEESRDYSGLFRGWFNNRMTVVLMVLQNPSFRPPQTMQRIEFFLEEVEHHFVDAYAPKSIRNAFRYLKRYFRIYPNVTESHCRCAIQMVGRIYQALGMKFGFQPEIDDLPYFRKQKMETCKVVTNSGMGI